MSEQISHPAVGRRYSNRSTVENYRIESDQRFCIASENRMSNYFAWLLSLPPMKAGLRLPHAGDPVAGLLFPVRLFGFLPRPKPAQAEGLPGELGLRGTFDRN